jgi:hypothetical protein
MTYEETLGELLAMVGHHVDVTVSSADPLVLVASYHGALARGDDIAHPSSGPEAETLMFVIGDSAAGAFVIERQAFVGAAFVGAGLARSPLEIRVGSAILTIDAADRCAP